MKIVDILKPNLVFLDVEAASKKQALEEVAEVSAPLTGCEHQAVFDALIEPERLGTTGIGKGVAIPHARLPGLKDLFCAFMRTKPLDFESIDGKPVDLIFFLLVPEESGADHLKALARISKLLRNEDVCTQLRAAKTKEEILKIIETADADE